MINHRRDHDATYRKENPEQAPEVKYCRRMFGDSTKPSTFHRNSIGTRVRPKRRKDGYGYHEDADQKKPASRVGHQHSRNRRRESSGKNAKRADREDQRFAVDDAFVKLMLRREVSICKTLPEQKERQDRK